METLERKKEKNPDCINIYRLRPISLLPATGLAHKLGPSRGPILDLHTTIVCERPAKRTTQRLVKQGFSGITMRRSRCESTGRRVDDGA
jgi:hypothetical protein